MRPLEDYALIGDTETAALIDRDGSMGWLCLPRFDADACFAALLGDYSHGHWTIAPSGAATCVRRGYYEDSLVLETVLECRSGAVRLVDCMPIRAERPDLTRRVEGVHGTVGMRSEFAPRPAYGSTFPWIRMDGRRLEAIAGPDFLTLTADVEFTDTDPDAPAAEFTVRAGDSVDFRLSYGEGDRDGRLDAGDAMDETIRWWRDWVAACTYQGPYRDAVIRSLITLKALIHAPTGGMVAAPTTSLPEQLGGVRNWDYRYCWIRDATLTLLVPLDAGYVEEARHWRERLLRAVAGRPEQMQILYGIDGRRRLTEVELPWLPGYEKSAPVRIGNGAAGQHQLDIYGELMDALHQARTLGIPPDPEAWRVQRTLMDFLESNWSDPDNGVWEMRGPLRHFTHSKVMAWVAADRAVQAVDRFGLDGPQRRWKRLRQEIFDEVSTHGYDAARGTFTQYYGSSTLDASLLMIPLVGFLPATDERVRGTTRAIERELMVDGFVRRYTMTEATEALDGLPVGEGAFLACSFWLADNDILQGETDKGRRLFERLLGLRNDVGLLAEQYDPRSGRLLGNFPQALSHIPLVNTALALESAGKPPRAAAAGRWK